MMPEERQGATRTIAIPDHCLVVLIGASGSGKSTFAARHFRPTAVLSSDHYRAVVGDDPEAQHVTPAAFNALHHIAGLRLGLGRQAVIDATSVKAVDRASLLRLAQAHNVPAIAIVFNLEEAIMVERNARRTDRRVAASVIRRQMTELRRGLRGLEHEGFSAIAILRTPAEVDGVQITQAIEESEQRSDHGPFDIIGDVHGCYIELVTLLEQLGYVPDEAAGWRHPAGRRIIFVGDLVDRGPQTVEVVDLAVRMAEAGQALCVPGNHDDKLLRYLKGNKVKIAHGLEQSIAQLDALDAAAHERWIAAYRHFMERLPTHLILDDGLLVIAHAGMREDLQGGTSPRVRSFALFGETTGEIDTFGLPVRIDWAADYRGPAAVVYGHTPVLEATWINRTIDIDTGCVFGGQLTALCWPERQLVSVPAQRAYADSLRPLESRAEAGDTAVEADGAASAATLTREEPSGTLVLRLEDVQGKQLVATALVGPVRIAAEQAAAALEVMSRYAIDPRWLITLPPTMAPGETSLRVGYLEYPEEALAYYRQQGISRAVCEEKHMGSRAILVLCRDVAVARRRFGVPGDIPGTIFTRTGRQFFEDDALHRAIIARLIDALGSAGCWERWATDWVCLDAEILPWSAKARDLLRTQYAPAAAAGAADLAAIGAVLRTALGRGLDLAELAERTAAREANIAAYHTAYGRYCWDVLGLDDIRVAPFHLLATEGNTGFVHDHLWHMAELGRLAEHDPLWLATRHLAVDLMDDAAVQGAIAWWEDLTGQGGEGMVVKPLDFIARRGKRLVQPAVKSRGREYLRIIYGPDYTLPDQLERLRDRKLDRKRALAVREFALGAEALERFVAGAPLWQVHQAVFGVLALESEPLDPRL